MRHAFRKTMMTRHILIPVHIFFILGRQIMPSRESRTHVLKSLARTLPKCSLLLNIVLGNRSFYRRLIKQLFPSSWALQRQEPKSQLFHGPGVDQVANDWCIIAVLETASSRVTNAPTGSFCLGPPEISKI